MVIKCKNNDEPIILFDNILHVNQSNVTLI